MNIEGFCLSDRKPPVSPLSGGLSDQPPVEQRKVAWLE